MENPEGWTLLTSSLWASPLKDPAQTWSLLVMQGLVKEGPSHRLAFEAMVREVVDEGPITGPSEASRVASSLVAAGLCLPPAFQPDPRGSLAQAWMDTLRGLQAEARQRLA